MTPNNLYKTIAISFWVIVGISALIAYSVITADGTPNIPQFVDTVVVSSGSDTDVMIIHG